MFNKDYIKEIDKMKKENVLRYKMWDMQLMINRNLLDKLKKYETLTDNLMEEVFILMHEDEIPDKLNMTGTTKLHLSGTGRF